MMAISNLVGAVFLAPTYGALGICISICIAYFVRTIGMDIILFYDLKINVFTYFRETYGKMLMPLILSLLVGFLCDYIVPIHSWMGFVIKGCIFILCYFIIMYTMSMNSSEKELLSSIFRKSVK